MRLRALIPLMPGCFWRAYLEISQKRFWQSMSCRCRPHSVRNVNPSLSNSDSWRSVTSRITSDSFKPPKSAKHL